MLTAKNPLVLFMALLIGAASFLPTQMLNIISRSFIGANLNNTINVFSSYGFILIICYYLIRAFIRHHRLNFDFYVSAVSNIVTGIALLFMVGIKFETLNNEVVIVNPTLIINCSKTIAIFQYLSFWSNLSFLFNYQGILACFGGIGTSIFLVPAYIYGYYKTFQGYYSPFGNDKAICIVYGIVVLSSVAALFLVRCRVPPSDSTMRIQNQPTDQYDENGYQVLPATPYKSPSIWSLFFLLIPFCFCYPYLPYGLTGKIAGTAYDEISGATGCYLGIFIGMTVGFSMFKVPIPRLITSIAIAVGCFVIWLVSWWTTSAKIQNIFAVIGGTLCAAIACWPLSRLWYDGKINASFEASIVVFTILFFVCGWIAIYIFT